jgi:hypothetical protein
MSVERFVEGDELLALVIRASYSADGIQFFTGEDSSQQLGYMKRPRGYEVSPHRHHRVDREVTVTQEVLLLRSGSCRLELYGSGTAVIHDTVLRVGDVVLLAAGGHGLVMLEESELIEIKQGPYAGDADKVRFVPGSAEK